MIEVPILDAVLCEKCGLYHCEGDNHACNTAPAPWGKHDGHLGAVEA